MGLHKKLGNNTSPDVHGSTTSSPHPPATTHVLLSHSPPASGTSSDGLALLPSQPPISGNSVPLPTQNSGYPHLPQVSNATFPSVSTPHNLHTLSSSTSPTSVTPEHSTTSSSQPITTSQHRSLRRILSQDQIISISPRKLRSRYIHTASSL